MSASRPNPGEHPAADRLHVEVDALFDLNPDRANMRRETMIALAEDCPGERFDEFAERARELVDAYLSTPWKAAGRGILTQYFEAIRTSARRLIDRGDLSETVLQPDKDAEADPARQALQPARNAPSAEWCRLMREARIPPTLGAAVDAYRNRASRVSGVFEVMLCVLQAIDRDAAFHWQMAFLEQHREDLDPELTRDLLAAWRTVHPLPQCAVERLLEWSTDTGLLREWPAVTRQADALVQRTALRLLGARPTPPNSLLRRLHSLATTERVPHRALNHWLDKAMRSLGETIEFFIRMADRGGGETTGEPRSRRAEWSEAAVIRELESIESLYPHLLLLADVLLRTADGAARFAYALFGFTERGWQRWRERLDTYAREVVARLFLRDLRERRSVVPTIHRLSFGDETLVLKLKGHLDLASGQFLSVSDRNTAAAELAPYYASFREQELLAREVTRRYRQLMRVLHADNLHRILPPDAAARFAESPALRDMSALAASARVFLNHRRALHAPLDETLATEADFMDTLRRQRAAVIRRLR